MAFSFSNAGQGNGAFGGQAAASAQAGTTAKDGPDLREILTDVRSAPRGIWWTC